MDGEIVIGFERERLKLCSDDLVEFLNTLD